MPLDVDRVQLHHAIDKRAADAAPIIFVRCDFRRYLFTEYDASPALHQKEWRADHARIVAHQVTFRRRRKVGMTGLEDARLTNHVVSLWSDWSERGPAEYVFAPADAQQVRQVRMTARKLLDFDAPPGSLDFSTQILAEGAGIELFALADRVSIRVHAIRSEEHTSELQSRFGISYAVFCLKK